MSKVAFLGLGAMGSRMAANLLKAGHELTVWNLTPEAANKLAASGAKAAATPREAAEGNDFIIAMVSNDEASRHVWLDRSNGALAGAKAGAIAIESSTLTLHGSMNLAASPARSASRCWMRWYLAALRRQRERSWCSWWGAMRSR